MENSDSPFFTTRKPLILASASPRRRKMLEQLDINFEIRAADIDEHSLPDESPADFARRMAVTKAATVARRYPDSWVLGADTVVSLGNSILGKPATPGEALAMLTEMSGREHRVFSGYALCCRQEKVDESGVACSRVIFHKYDEETLRAYINTGEPMDKAGAYGIQGRGAFLVKTLHGSCTNVIGLPLDTVVRLLLDHGVIVSAAPGRKRKLDQ